MSKNKVIHIITSSDVGGAQQHLLDVVSNINKDHFEPIVICGVGGNFEEKLTKVGIRTYKLLTLDKKIDFIKDIRTFIAIVQLLRVEKPAIVHCHSSKAGLLGRLAAKVAGVPITVFTAHGFVFHDFMTPFQRNFYTFLERFAGLFTSHIITVSNQDKEKALKNKVIAVEKVTTIHNGIDTHKFQPIASEGLENFKSSLGIKNNDKVVGLVGRLVKEKGINYLIEAAEEIRKSCRNTKFVIVGDGPLRTNLEKLVEQKNLNNYFIFTGLSEDVKVLLSLMDIVVFSSIKEGLPLALLEALALEKAVVASSVGGIPEVIITSQNGLLVAPGNVNELAKAIECLLKSDHLRREFGVAGRQRVNSSFTLDQMVTSTEQVYQQLLKERKLL